MKEACSISRKAYWEDSPMFNLFDLLGKKRIINISYAISQGYNWFNEIKDSIPFLSSKILSNRLKLLQKEGLVAREIENETPVKIRYHLTDLWKKIADKVCEMWKMVW
jgi:DNA-binding HxlR family transcriptional regulator